MFIFLLCFLFFLLGIISAYQKYQEKITLINFCLRECKKQNSSLSDNTALRITKSIISHNFPVCCEKYFKEVDNGNKH